MIRSDSVFFDRFFERRANGLAQPLFDTRCDARFNGVAQAVAYHAQESMRISTAALHLSDAALDRLAQVITRRLLHLLANHLFQPLARRAGDSLAHLEFE
jgi:hypothetical protein